MNSRMIFSGVAAVMIGAGGFAAEVTSVATAAKERMLPAHFFGQNSNLVRGGNWYDARYTDSINRLRAGHVRFPAGTLANYWDWKTGWFKESAHLPYGLTEAKKNPYTLDSLKVVANTLGAKCMAKADSSVSLYHIPPGTADVIQKIDYYLAVLNYHGLGKAAVFSIPLSKCNGYGTLENEFCRIVNLMLD